MSGRPATRGPAPGSGVEGNPRLTATNAVVLLVLLAVEGFTILGVRAMITLHIFLGIVLIGPVLLKTGSTLYRFARYYSGVPPTSSRGRHFPCCALSARLSSSPA